MRGAVWILLGAMLALTACGGGGSSRPSYSGHEESTAGVPGFSPDGQRKLHPNVKLGQSYTVSGKTYVPRYQPDYDETGMASWYGPGFHGGKTANGERYNMGDHTAAHTTLPMPSIVKVTYLKTGRSSYARVNDRGPFAHGRIIDLSKAVAEEIGLARDGIGKVRVQYLPQESERFVELMLTGRPPQSIDLASEIIGKQPMDPVTQYADVSTPDERVGMVDLMPVDTAPLPKPTLLQQISPIASAQAAEPVVIAQQPPVPVITPMPPSELPPALPSGPAIKVAPVQQAPPIAPPMAAEVSPAQPLSDGPYVQLGAFANQANARAMQQRFASLGDITIVPFNAGGIPMYRVRLGPFINQEAGIEMLERAQQMGVAGAKLVTGYR